jgi:hypothetical protein
MRPRLLEIAHLGAIAALTLGCGSEPLQGSMPDPGSNPDAGGAPATTLVARGVPPTAFQTVYQTTVMSSATALAFDPERSGELWTLLREPPSTLPCTVLEPAGCAALPGEVALVRNALSAAPQALLKSDRNAWHFMRRPTAIAFGDNGNLATCGEARSDNYDDDSVDFSGPTLWSSDPAIFGAAPPPMSPTGSTHIDMLHDSPFCMGIAHERDNVYWVFNGLLGALDRYDFKQPHAPGEDDHTDGELERFVEGALTRVPEVPSHLAFDAELGLLYAADTGHGRIVALDAASGTPGQEVPQLDGIALHVRIDGARLTELVPPGVLERPSGLSFQDGRLFATDNATSAVYEFDRSGTKVRTIALDLPSGSLAGITLGPDQKLYLTDLLSAHVYRVELD